MASLSVNAVGARRHLGTAYMPRRGHLVTNREIEDTAIKWVMESARAAGRAPVDTRRSRNGPATNIISPPRVIGVKACGRLCRGCDLLPEARQVDEERSNPTFTSVSSRGWSSAARRSSRARCSMRST